MRLNEEIDSDDDDDDDDDDTDDDDNDCDDIMMIMMNLDLSNMYNVLYNVTYCTNVLYNRI